MCLITKADIGSDVVTDLYNNCNNLDWYILSAYIILVFILCLYFKKTGKRLKNVENVLKHLVPKVNPISRTISFIVRTLALLLFKKHDKHNK